MADLTTLRTWLSEAETALHKLQTGTRIVQVWNNGRRIEYASTPDGINQLKLYISELNGQIAALSGESSSDWRLKRRAGRPFYT